MIRFFFIHKKSFNNKMMYKHIFLHFLGEKKNIFYKIRGCIFILPKIKGYLYESELSIMSLKYFFFICSKSVNNKIIYKNIFLYSLSGKKKLIHFGSDFFFFFCYSKIKGCSHKIEFVKISTNFFFFNLIKIGL